jgi:poly-gamma-glutamate capsule biosynthesis protein CapA/YwtB (metallophosphatase superfamily)
VNDGSAAAEPIMASLNIAIVGDVMLGRGVNETLRREQPHYPWGDTLTVLRSADVRIANLECVISDRGEPWEGKEFHFRCDEANVGVLSVAGIDAVSLANNHSLDFGFEALADCLRVLDSAKILHSGVGANLGVAFAPAIVSASGMTIGVISFTDNEPMWEAGPDRPGIAYVPVDFDEKERTARLFGQIERTRREVDLLIVSAHWGPNWGYEPPKRQIPFAHHMIDLGADAIFGHSGHVFRGVEIYRDRPIIYCAGDFVDDYAVDETERNDESFIFVAEYGSRRCRRLCLYPTVIEKCQARIAGPDRAEEVAYKMIRLCRKMATQAVWHSDQGFVEIPVTRV